MKKLICLIYLAILAASNLLPFAVPRANAAPVNLINNASVETTDSSGGPQNWLKGGWGTNSRSLTYPATGHTGSHSVRVDITSYSDGDAKWYFSPVAITGGVEYTFSDFYQSNVASSVIAQFDDGSGNYSYQDISVLPASAAAWAQGSVNFTAPVAAKNVSIFHLINGIGWLQTDDFSLSAFSAPAAPTVTLTAPAGGSTLSGIVQLTANAEDTSGIAGVQFQADGVNVGAEDTSAPYQIDWDTAAVSNGTHNLTAIARNTANLTTASSPVQVNVNNGTTPPPVTTNLVPNSSVETADSANPAKPQDWTNAKTGTNTTAFNYLNTGHTGSRSLQVNMTSRSSGNAKWYFNPVTVSPSTAYKFSDWYQSSVASHYQVVVTRTNGTTVNTASGSIAKSTAWKQFSVSFTTPADAKSVTVYHYLNKVGQLTTDDFSLEGPGGTVPTPPAVNISAPANGSVISGNQTISANATDQQGISNVQIKLDGVNLGNPVTTSPYNLNWDTTTATNGSHTLTAVATNTNGLSTTSAGITVDVQNSVSNPPPVSDNLVANPSVETPNASNPNAPDKWSSNNWGTNTVQYSYVSGGHSGSKSVKAQITSYSSGDAKWYFNPVSVEANKSYTFSDYYQSSINTEIVAQIEDAGGNLTYAYLGAAAANSSWTPYSVTFTTPATARQVTVFHLIAGVGYLAIDDASLMLTPPPPPQTDVIPNNSLEYAAPGNPDMPIDWTKSNWGTNTAKFEYLNEGHTGNRSVKVTVSNYTDGDAKWYFEPLSTFQPGKMYRFSVWYKTNTIPHAVAMFLKADGTEQYFGMPNPQPNGTGDWQFYSDTFTVPLDAVAASAFLFMPGNGWVQTDDYSITDYQPVGWNRPLVTLTFDDGYEDNVTTVLPVLNQYGFKSTQCYETMDVEGNQSAINDVKTFYNSGHEICAHTVTHPMLTQIPMSQVTYELTHSQQVLENIIGAPVRDFASPYGDYNKVVDTEIAKYFRSHRTVDEGFNSKDNFDIYRLRVQNMTPTTSLEQVKAWLDQAKATNTWLILVYHRVADSELDPFDTYTKDFKLQMQALSQSGLTVKTWSDALDEVTAQL